MNIAVIGTGYVGLATSLAMAEIGHCVVGVDKEKGKIDLLKQGELPFWEPLARELLLKHLTAGRLSFTTSLSEALHFADVIFICVGTPLYLINGGLDVTAIEKLCKDIARLIIEYKVIVVKSTVPIATGDRIKQIILREFRSLNKQIEFDIVSNPEFLREGSAIYDVFNPARIIIGVESDRAKDIITALYMPIIERKIKLQGMPDVKEKLPVIYTDIKTAELIKQVANAFLATKLSFINAIANVCELVGVDIDDVVLALGYDPRIGREYLQAGIGFGGSCLPKDLNGFIEMCSELGYSFDLLKEVNRINQEQREKFIYKIKQTLQTLQNKMIGVLGLSFKPDTDDIRKSPALDVIEFLLSEGALVKAYDPASMKETAKLFPQLNYCTSPYEVARGTEALIIITDWKEFKDMDLNKIKLLMKYPIIIDGRNIFLPSEMKKLGFEYISIGRGKK